MSPTPLDPSQTRNGLNLDQIGDVLMSPNNACTSMGEDAEPVDEEEVVAEPTEILVYPMSTIIQHRPQEMRKITDKIRIQVAAWNVVDATVEVLDVALISATDSLGCY